jgi:DNA repair protein RecO (recombination protein O)
MADRIRLYTAEGIVLRRQPVGEADALVTLLSPTHGRFTAVARGVRKPASRTRGHVEPLTHGRYLFARGRTFDVLTQAETLRTFPRLERSLLRQAAALYTADLAAGLAAEQEPAPELFGLLVSVLAALDAGAGLLAVRYFELRATAEAGYAMHLGSCVRCGSALPPEPAFFAPSAGGLLCSGCRSDGVPGTMVEVRVIKLLRYGLAQPLERFLALRVDEATAEQAARALRAWVCHLLEREPVSARYLDEICALEARTRPAEAVYHS